MLFYCLKATPPKWKWLECTTYCVRRVMRTVLLFEGYPSEMATAVVGCKAGVFAGVSSF